MSTEFKNALTPVKYIEVTPEFREVIADGIHKIYKGTQVINEFLKDDLMVEHAHLNYNETLNEYTVTIIHRDTIDYFTRTLTIKDGQYLVLFKKMTCVLSDIDLINIQSNHVDFEKIIQNTKMKSIIKSIIRKYKYHRVYDNHIKHLKEAYKHDKDIINSYFNKYILRDSKNKRQFKNELRHTLQHDYPEMNDADIESYVKLILKQSK